MQRLNLTSAILTVASLACIAGAQIVIPPGVLENRPPKKVTTKTPTTKPAGDKQDIQRLIIDFRQAAGDGPQREKAAGKLLRLGPTGAKKLRRIIAADLPHRTADYKKAFYNKARSIGVAKYRATGSARVEKWRAQFKSLGAVTKESILARGGPPMDALYEALVPNRKEILEKNMSLTDRREELISLDSILEQCNTVLKLKSEPSKLPETLEQQETLISLMCTYMSSAQRKPTETALKQFGKMAFEEWHAFVHLNVIRVMLGLRPMQLDLRLAAAGRDHSKDMYERKFFAHESPVPGKKTPWDRAARQGVKASGECIAAGMASGPSAIRGWFFSPGHHKIIMSGAAKVGIGKYGRHWTLMTG